MLAGRSHWTLGCGIEYWRADPALSDVLACSVFTGQHASHQSFAYRCRLELLFTGGTAGKLGPVGHPHGPHRCFIPWDTWPSRRDDNAFAISPSTSPDLSTNCHRPESWIRSGHDSGCPVRFRLYVGHGNLRLESSSFDTHHRSLLVSGSDVHRWTRDGHGSL